VIVLVRIFKASEKVSGPETLGERSIRKGFRGGEKKSVGKEKEETEKSDFSRTVRISL